MSSHVPHLPSSLVLVGAGKMGGAMLEGWLANGMEPAGVTVLDPRPSEDMMRLCAERGIALNPRQAGAVPKSLVLAIKPQMLDDAAAAGERACLGPRDVVVSMIAGKTIGDLKARLPAATAIIRAMPNLPASIGRGATGAAATRRSSETQRALADALLRSVGIVEWLESEDLIDAVTALSGSGPAYVFHLVECLAEAGRAAGLPADLAGEPRPRHGHRRGRVAVPQRAFARDPPPERHLARRHDRRRAGNAHGRSGGAEGADAGCGRCGKAACRGTLWLKQGVAGSARTT